MALKSSIASASLVKVGDVQSGGNEGRIDFAFGCCCFLAVFVAQERGVQAAIMKVMGTDCCWLSKIR